MSNRELANVVFKPASYVLGDPVIKLGSFVVFICCFFIALFCDDVFYILFVLHIM